MVLVFFHVCTENRKHTFRPPQSFLYRKRNKKPPLYIVYSIWFHYGLLTVMSYSRNIMRQLHILLDSCLENLRAKSVCLGTKTRQMHLIFVFFSKSEHERERKKSKTRRFAAAHLISSDIICRLCWFTLELINRQYYQNEHYLTDSCY